jgi:hypothetical protein
MQPNQLHAPGQDTEAIQILVYRRVNSRNPSSLHYPPPDFFQHYTDHRSSTYVAASPSTKYTTVITGARERVSMSPNKADIYSTHLI